MNNKKTPTLLVPAHWTPAFCRGYCWTAGLQVHPFFLCLVLQFICI